jgi:hypothetical protein
MIDEPLETWPSQDTIADALPATAETPVGAKATEIGIREADAEEATELPVAFIARTVNVTGVPLVRPVTESDNTLPTVTGLPPLPTDGVTLYPVIAEPPFKAGAVQETIAEFIPASAETPVGWDGWDALSEIGEEKSEYIEFIPLAFVALTINETNVPLVRPVTEAVRTFPTITEVPADAPTYGVTVYRVIAELPLEVGAVHETVAAPLPATAETPVGALGALIYKFSSY